MGNGNMKPLLLFCSVDDLCLNRRIERRHVWSAVAASGTRGGPPARRERRSTRSTYFTACTRTSCA
jgi:hypothetical protein